jgi:hypothetical protein
MPNNDEPPEDGGTTVILNNVTQLLRDGASIPIQTKRATNPAPLVDMTFDVLKGTSMNYVIFTKETPTQANSNTSTRDTILPYRRGA